MCHTRHAGELIAAFAEIGLRLVVMEPVSATSIIRIIGDQSQVTPTYLAELVAELREDRAAIIDELVRRGESADPASANHLPGRASAGGVGQGRGGRPARQATSDQTFHRLATLLTDRLRSALGISDGQQVIQVVALRCKPIKAVTLQDWIDRTNVHGHTAFSCTTAGREVAAYYPPTDMWGNPYAR